MKAACGKTARAVWAADGGQRLTARLLRPDNRRKTQEPLESSTIFESAVIVAQLTFSLPLHLPKRIGWYHANLASSVGQPFSAAHFPGHCFGPIPAPGSFAALLSRFLPNGTGPSHKAPARLGSSGLSLLGAPGKWGKKKPMGQFEFLGP